MRKDMKMVKWSKVFVALVVFVLLVKGLLVGLAALAIREDYRALVPLLDLGPAELIQPTNLTKLAPLLVRSETDLKRLRDETAPLLLVAPYFGWLPYYGGDIVQSPGLMNYAIEAVAAARAAVQMASPLLQQMSASGGMPKDRSAGEILLNSLNSLDLKTNGLAAHIEGITAARRSIDVTLLSPTLARLVSRGDKLLDQMTPAIRSVDFLPGLLGMQGTRKYLVIFQNNEELRPTGGFIGSVGMVEVQNGKIIHTDFENSYAIDDLTKPHPIPPQPLTDYMWAGIWVFRDGNWSPDFPTAAKTLEGLYLTDQDVQVDGVIAVNLRFAQRMVDALAPIDLPAYGEQVDGQNVLERIEHYYAAPIGVAHSKDFIGAVMQGVIAKLNGAEGSVDLPRVFPALWESLLAKDLLIYVNEPEPASVLHDLYWDGGLPSVTGDAVLVVDSNVGFNKVDSRIERQFDYRVELQAGNRAHATLRMHYSNQNLPSAEPCLHPPVATETYDAIRDNCYFDYVRIYMPEGSTLITVSGGITQMAQTTENGYAVLGGFFEVPRGQARELEFEYWLPTSWISADGESVYTLKWIKQPGANDAAMRATIVVPDSFQIVGAYPSPTSRTNSTLDYVLPTDRDTTIAVRVAPANGLGQSTMPLAVLLACMISIPYLLGKRLLWRKRS